MALKDKLMTLEDFKAVRDVDVASNSAQFTEIKADLENLAGGGTEQREIQFVYGTFINDGNAAEIGDTVDLTNLTEWYSLKHAIVECQEGDEFLIDMAGAANARAWAFLTSNNVLISRSNANETVTGKITAPQNAGKVIIQGIYRQTPQDTSTDEGTAYKLVQGTGKVVRFDVEQDKTEEEKATARHNLGITSADGLTEDIKQALLNCFKHVYFKDTDADYYKALETALYPSLPEPLYDWDFTESLTDKVSGQVAVLKKNTNGSLPTRGANGVHFSGYGQSIQLFGDSVTLEQSLKGKTLQVDVASFTPASGNSNAHTRFIMFSKGAYDITQGTYNVGIIYRANGASSQWSMFTCKPSAATGSWANGYGITNRSAISGHTVSVYIGNDYRPKLYIDRQSYGFSNVAFYPNLVSLFIGSNDSAGAGASFYDAIVTGARIYEGDIYNGL